VVRGCLETARNWTYVYSLLLVSVRMCESIDVGFHVRLTFLWNGYLFRMGKRWPHTVLHRHPPLFMFCP